MTIPTTDTVATQTLAQHILHTTTGPSFMRTTTPRVRCLCGRGGDERWGMLHLVEMGVEAGVAAVMELREATQELTPLERAERDLVGYLAGMEGADRELDVESWRDVLAILVSCAADTDKRHAYPSTLGAHLWLELERLEGIDSIREDGAEPEPITDDRLAAHVRAYRHSSSALVDLSRRRQLDPRTGPSLPWLHCARVPSHASHEWEPVTSGAPRVAWCTGNGGAAAV